MATTPAPDTSGGLTPFAAELRARAAGANVKREPDKAARTRIEEAVRRFTVAHISTAAHVPPESVVPDGFTCAIVTLTGFSSFRLGASPQTTRHAGVCSTDSADTVFVESEEELEALGIELAKRELLAPAALDLMEKLALKYPGKDSFNVRQGMGCGVWQHSCPECYGRGRVPCRRCDSTGRVRCEACRGSGTERCGKCRGSGRQACSSCAGTGKRTCYTCHGSGMVKVLKSVREYDSYGNEREVGAYWEYHTCPDCGGYLPCFSCNGSGDERCSRCGGSGDVECSTCKGKGELVCGACGGAGSVTCQLCAGTGTVYDVIKAWSTATNTHAYFTGHFPKGETPPPLVIQEVLRNEKSREVGLLASCQVAICAFGVTGPGGERTECRAWAAFDPQSGPGQDIHVLGMEEACERFTAAKLARALEDLGRLSFFRGDFVPELSRIAGDFFLSPFLAESLNHPGRLGTNSNLALCRKNFISACRKLSWRVTLPLLALTAGLLLAILELRPYWLPWLRSHSGWMPRHDAAVFSYGIILLMGMGAACVAVHAKTLLVKRGMRRIIEAAPGFDQVASDDAVASTAVKQNLLLIAGALLCTWGTAFVEYFEKDIPVWLEEGRRLAAQATEWAQKTGTWLWSWIQVHVGRIEI